MITFLISLLKIGGTEQPYEYSHLKSFCRRRRRRRRRRIYDDDAFTVTVYAVVAVVVLVENRMTAGKASACRRRRDGADKKASSLHGCVQKDSVLDFEVCNDGVTR